MHEQPTLLAISVSTPSWLEKLQQGYEDDEEARKILVQLSL
jgi:hypothetical protein